MKSTIYKWIILIALIAYTTFVAVWANERAGERHCNGIVVSGDASATEGIISELAQYDAKLLGKPVDKINTAQIEKHLMGKGNFESVQCAILSDGRLLVDIKPMVPELRVFSGGETYYINREGRRIAADAKFFADVPIATGRFSKEITPKDLLPLVRYIKANEAYDNLFSMIKVDSPNDVLLVPRITGHIVNIGNLDDIPRKLHNVLLAYKEIMPYKGWNRYDTISVKFKGQIVASRRDKALLNHTPEYEEGIDFDEDALVDNEAPQTQAADTTASKKKDTPKAETKKKPENKKPNG